MMKERAVLRRSRRLRTWSHGAACAMPFRATRSHPMSHSDDALAPTTGAPPEVSPRQQRAILALATGATDRKAAEAAGVARETVSRWRNHDPVFRAALDQARAAIWRANVEALEALGTDAVAVLRAALSLWNDQLRVRTAMYIADITGLAAAAGLRAATSRVAAEPSTTVIATLAAPAGADGNGDRDLAREATALIAESRAVRMAVAVKYSEPSDTRAPTALASADRAAFADLDLPLPPE